MKMVLIPENDLNVLRETLETALKIIQCCGVAGSVTAPGKTPKETKRDREIRYTRMLDTKTRGTKPNHLKKSHGKN